MYYYLLCCLPHNTVHKEVVIGLVGCLFTRLFFFFVVCYFNYFTAFLLRGSTNTLMCILYHVVRGCSSHITLPEEDTIGSILVVILQKRHSLHWHSVSSSNGELESTHCIQSVLVDKVAAWFQYSIHLFSNLLLPSLDTSSFFVLLFLLYLSFLLCQYNQHFSIEVCVWNFLYEGCFFGVARKSKPIKL